jgi:hypothetical protein
MCLFHRWVRVEDVGHSACGECFAQPNSWRIPDGQAKEYPKGYCPHSFRVCSKCGKAEGYGSHGKLTLVPDTCKEQVAAMQPKAGG